MACPYTHLFVVCTNTVYVILFLVLVAVAFTVHFLKIPNALALYKGSVITDINDVILATGLGDADYYGDRDLVLFLSSFLLVIFIAGLVLLVVAFTGCYAGCCKYSAISKLYAVVLILMLVVEFMLVIAVYGFPNSLVMGSIKSTMTSFLTSRYEGLVGNSTETFGWNFIMSKYQCCGVYGYNDFKGTNHWKSNVVAKGNLYTLKIPIVCCDQLPTSGNLTCAEATTGINANKGCFEELWNVSLGSPPVAILALGVGLILQLSLIFAAFNLSDKDKKGRVEPHLDKWNK
ncbi:tetraspanin-1-like [Saccostrea echinata]|uniref:tetraspanin-1-like n=1 Tax=Saccostrea echinata TaxID=191078 RepID=UPI002A8094B4|nr:tetraspanin-1-like [Saccostrea echinata]